MTSGLNIKQSEFVIEIKVDNCCFLLSINGAKEKNDPVPYLISDLSLNFC